ncbi:MAG: sporulation integral membrane protein YtvI [Clostridia bacterium]|nr:sporulation integral membrane protein YtvI [Clostridia bacterium]
MILISIPKVANAIGYAVWLFAPFIIAYFVSLIVNPMVHGIEKRFRLPRGVCAILVIVLTVGVLGGIITAIIWKVIDEVRNVYEDLPIIYENVRIAWIKISVFFSDFVAMLPENLQNVFDDTSNQVLDWFANIATNTQIVRSAGNIAKKLPSIFVVTVVFILSLYFMITDAKKVSLAVKKPFSEEFIQKMKEFKTEIKKYVGGYLKAQLTIMCISFTIILIGLSILKIDYALVIAIAVAILDALPFFGSGAVLWPWAIIAFIMGDVLLGVGLIIIYLAVILMRQFVEPKIVSQNIGIHPITTLMSMYVGFRIFSIGGMIVGPLVMVLLVSLYRTGIFDGVVTSAKKLFKRFGREIKSLTNSLNDEENKDGE